MPRYETLLFDLDGTLVDSKPGITRGVQHALARFDIHVDNLNSPERYIGPPLVQSFQLYQSFDEQQARMALAYYREYYDAQGIYEAEAYAGIADLLNLLAAQGKRLIVATSKPTVYAEPMLERSGLRGYFAAVHGSKLDLSNAAKSAIIADALAPLDGVDRIGVVMIGDREHDIHGAQANGIASIAAAYGYGTQDELTAALPTHLVATMRELRDLLAGQE